MFHTNTEFQLKCDIIEGNIYVYKAVPPGTVLMCSAATPENTE